MTTQDANSMDSATTGEECRGRQVASWTGSGRGATVCGAQRLAVSAALAGRQPQEVDNSLTTYCQQSSGRRVAFERRMMFPENGPAYSMVTGVSWNCPPEAIEKCTKAIEASMRSAPEDDLAKAFYRLRILTRGREQRAGDNAEAEAVIWIENLKCWPGDIAISVLNTWTSRADGMWWPSWSEVEKELRAKTSQRQALANHIAALPKPSEERNIPPEEREKVGKLFEDLAKRMARDDKHKPQTGGRFTVEDEIAMINATPIRVSAALIDKITGAEQ